MARAGSRILRTWSLLLGVWLACGFAPGSATLVETGVFFETAAWDLDAAEDVNQGSAALSGEFAWGAQWGGRFQVSGARGSGSGTSFGPRLAGMALMRYKPRGSWLIQAGIDSPSGIRHLTGTERSVARLLGDPALHFAEPDPVRGWRIHLGTVAGFPLSHRARLMLSAGGDLATSVEAAPDAPLNPADRISLATAIEAQLGRHEVHARLSLGLEGEETVGGDRIRGRRNLLGCDGGVRFRFAAVSAAVTAALATTSSVSLPEPGSYGIWQDQGPGRLAQLGISTSSVRAITRLFGWSVRPSVGITWRRVQPAGLPIGDSWTVRALPGLTFMRGTTEVALTLGWGTGTWRSWETGSDEGGSSLRGWMLRTEVRQRRDSATAEAPE